MIKKKQLHVVTNSEVEAWRKCHAFWGFGYAEGLRPVVRPLPLSFGNIYHAGAAGGWRAAWSEPEASLDTRLAWAVTGARAAILAKAEAFLAELAAAPLGPDDNLQELQGVTEESRDIALWAAGHYFERVQPELDFVPLAIEAPFRIHVPNAGGAPSSLLDDGVMDLVLWDREGSRIVLQDHKGTAYGVHTLEQRVVLDTQITGYMIALRMLLGRAFSQKSWADPFWSYAPAAAQSMRDRSVFLAGVGSGVFNVVRRHKPSQPKLNLLAKKWATLELQRALYAAQEEDGVPRGEVSVAQIDTTPEVYADALLAQQVERGLEVTEKQRLLLQSLKARTDTFFCQVEFYRGPEEFERWRKELWVDAKRMRSALRKPEERTRNPSACTSPSSPICPYRAVCLAPDSPEARSGFRVAVNKHEEVREAQEHERHTSGSDGLGAFEEEGQPSPVNF